MAPRITVGEIQRLKRVLRTHERNRRAWRKLRWVALAMGLVLISMAIYDAFSMRELANLLDYPAQGLESPRLTAILDCHARTVNAQMRYHFLAVFCAISGLWGAMYRAANLQISAAETAAAAILRRRLDSSARPDGKP